MEELTGINILNELASKNLHITLANVIQLNLRSYEHSMHDSFAGVFEEWLAGQSPLAPTWENLLRALRDIDMDDLAKRIEQFFQSPTESRSKKSEVTGEKKELVDSLQQTLAKVERDLHESEDQIELLKAKNVALSTENELLKSENGMLRQQVKLSHDQLPSVEPTGNLSW